MTFAELSSGSACLLLFFCFLLCIFYLYGLSRSIVERVGLRFTLPYVLLLAVLTIPGTLLNRLVDTLLFSDSPTSVPAYFQQTPVMFVLIPLLVFTLLGIFLLFRLEQFISTRLTASSVQEGFDTMPDGVCFSTLHGIPLLVNRRMQAISMAAFGTGVLDAEALHRRLAESDLLPGCRTVVHGDDIFLHLPDGSVWDFRRSVVKAESVRVQESLAYDITERYEKSREMEMRNRHLLSINEQMRRYNRDLEAITHDQELLAAKIRLHDDLGRCLLALRAYLAQPDGDREKLTALWRFTISVLRREAESQENEDPMASLRQAAEAVDIRLVFDGEIPGDSEARKIIGMAVHECLTNAVKHAHAHTLTVRIRRTGNTQTVTLTNDGLAPTEPIREKGGLSSLRAYLEQHGAMMELESKPAFRLLITIDQEEVPHG